MSDGNEEKARDIRNKVQELKKMLETQIGYAPEVDELRLIALAEWAVSIEEMVAPVEELRQHREKFEMEIESLLAPQDLRLRRHFLFEWSRRHTKTGAEFAK